jgi:hypothetical protein
LPARLSLRTDVCPATAGIKSYVVRIGCISRTIDMSTGIVRRIEQWRLASLERGGPAIEVRARPLHQVNRTFSFTADYCSNTRCQWLLVLTHPGTEYICALLSSTQRPSRRRLSHYTIPQLLKLTSFRSLSTLVVSTCRSTSWRCTRIRPLATFPHSLL